MGDMRGHARNGPHRVISAGGDTSQSVNLLRVIASRKRISHFDWWTSTDLNTAATNGFPHFPLIKIERKNTLIQSYLGNGL